MQGDASILGIQPPHTVRITQEGHVEDWPWETIEVFPDRVAVMDPHYGNKVVAYEYVQAIRRDDGTWRFVGSEEDFTVQPGPAYAPASNGLSELDDDWPPDDRSAA